MKIEQNYDFRKELLTIHEANVRDLERKPLAHDIKNATIISRAAMMTKNIIVHKTLLRNLA